MEKYNSFEEEYAEVEVAASERSVTTELSSDFSLPDYQPEIKRLLRVTASMLPPTKYFGAGEAELAGNIDYYVLYIGSDDEIYCVPLTGEYSVDIPIDRKDGVELGDELCADITMLTEGLGGRVTSPRHLTVKCRLKTHVRIYGDTSVISNIRKCNGSIEKLKSEAVTGRVHFGVGETGVLTDEVIPESRDGEFRVICADGKPLVSEVSAGAGEVICRGDLHLKLLLSREDGGMPYTVNRRIPFSEIVKCEGVTPDCTAFARGCLSELTLTVDEGRIGIEAKVLLETTAQGNSAAEYIADIYSVCGESECEYKNMILPRALSSFNRNFTFSESISLADTGITQGAQVVDCYGAAIFDGLKYEGGKWRMLGRCRFSIQLFDGTDYSGADVELPFKYEYDMPMSVREDNIFCECEAGAVLCRARIDGERVLLDAEIGLCGRMWEDVSVTVLDSYRLGEQKQERRGEVLVCYPAGNDTLWSIAKKYNASIPELVRNNKLPQARPDSLQSLDGCKYLII